MFPVDAINRCVTKFNSYYPDVASFLNSRYMDEIRHPIQQASKTAIESLGREVFRDLMEAEDYSKIIQNLIAIGDATDLIDSQPTRSGDLGLLFQENIDKPTFCQQLFSYLHGNDSHSARMGSFIDYLDSESLVCNWAFLTYYPFLLDPSARILIKLHPVKNFIKFAEYGPTIKSRPDPMIYTEIRQWAFELREGLSSLKPQDFIDIIQFIKAVYAMVSKEKKEILPTGKRAEFQRMFEKFITEYATEDRGKAHLEMYGSLRRDVRRNFDDIEQMRSRGEDITDPVLLKLLPYSDWEVNRQRGALISIAPAINTDLKKWFEANGFYKPNDWPKVAEAIWAFFKSVADDPSSLLKSITEFTKSGYSKGFQTGFLTPALFSLKPDQFTLINNKSRRMLNYFSENNFKQALTDYPGANLAYKSFVVEVRPLVEKSGIDYKYEIELVDMFSHWLVTEYNFFKTNYWKIAPGENASQWNDCRKGEYIGIGWEAMGDLRSYKNKEEMKVAYNQRRKEHNWAASKAWTMLWPFANLIKKGDVIIANRGTSGIVGVGIVTNDYYYEDRPEIFKSRLPVHWFDAESKKIATQKNWVKTLVKLNSKKYTEELSLSEPPALADVENPKPPAGSTVDPFNNLKPVFDQIRDHLNAKLQLILYGPPGTGKTFIARAFARWWLAEENFGKSLQELTAAQRAVLDGEPQTNEQEIRFWWVTLSDRFRHWKKLFSGSAKVDLFRGRLTKNFPLVQAGDIVFGYQSYPQMKILALGRVVEEAHDKLNEETKKLETCITIEPVHLLDIPLKWIEIKKHPVLSNSEPVKNRAQGTIFSLSDEEAEALTELLEEENPGLTDRVESLPAVGALAEAEFPIEIVTFHPSYSYEEFVEGIHPITDEEDRVRYEIEDGIFRRICRRAERFPDKKFILIIDEINRGNIAKILGELITLLEADKRGLKVRLPYSKQVFSVPENIFIIGTMNTADRSITMLDVALRRRFAFLELMPQADLLNVEIAELGLNLKDILDTLNSRLRQHIGREKQIGHSYLMESGRDGGKPILKIEGINRALRSEIIPLLQEYCYEDYGLLEQLLGPKFVDSERGTINESVFERDNFSEALVLLVGDHNTD